MWYLFTQLIWLVLIAFVIGIAVGWFTAARSARQGE